MVTCTGRILKRSRTLVMFAVLDAVSEKLMPFGKLFLLVDEISWIPSALATGTLLEKARGAAIAALIALECRASPDARPTTPPAESR